MEPKEERYPEDLDANSYQEYLEWQREQDLKNDKPATTVAQQQKR